MCGGFSTSGGLEDVTASISLEARDRNHTSFESFLSLAPFLCCADCSESSYTLDKVPHISEDDVLQALCKIDPNKTCGPDDIHGKLLVEGASSIAKPLCRLFNMSIQTATLPNDWTRSNVTPVFKKGSRHLPSNYRPISLTSLIVKMMERLISSEITKFTVQHNILSPLQHGFRQGHSCQTQLLETIHQLAESLNSKSSAHVIFLDFSKAFDSVPHKRLLIKLHRIGIRGQLLQWIEAFIF